MDEQRWSDHTAEADRAGLGDRTRHQNRSVSLLVPAAVAPDRLRNVPDRDRGDVGRVAAANAAYLFGSATTIARASPFGDTASRVIAPN